MEYLKDLTKEELEDRKEYLEQQSFSISSTSWGKVGRHETDLLEKNQEEIDEINKILKAE